MINRVLIRIKVIQILYSFMLVEKPFSLEGTPSQPTKEKRFAYALYQDMIVLLVKLARSVEWKKGTFPLETTRFISRLLREDGVKALLARSAGGDFLLQRALPGLAERVKDSAIYKWYVESFKSNASAPDEHLWRDLFNLVIMADPEVGALVGSRQNFTLKGVERMKDMMNRTFSDFLVSQDNVRDVEKALDESLDKARELYFRLMALPVDITHLQEQIVDDNRYKFLKTEEDINPNLKFVENRLVETLRGEGLAKELDNYKIDWLKEDPVLVRSLLKAVVGSDVYKEYMADPESDFARDCELWRALYKKVLLENPDFLEALESKSVFWNDDIDIISTFVLKSFRKAEENGGGLHIFERFKDEEDERFGMELLRYVYKNKDTYLSLIHI